MPNVVTDNPAAFTGLLRALLILLVTFGVQISSAQQDALLNFAAALILVVSLVTTLITVKTTVPKTPSADASAAAIQVPPPA